MLSENFWNKYFRVYDVLNELYPYRELLQKFTSELKPEAQEVILDAGAGTGNLASKIAKHGARLYTIDISDAGTRLLLEKIPEANTCVGSLCDTLPFPDNFFDAIVSNNVIYTLPEKDRPAVSREFYRVLKPGGRVIVSNIAPWFSPMNIYMNHLKEELKRAGPWKTIAKVIRFISPTIAMFWYNARIQRENSGGGYLFLDETSQGDFLRQGGFRDVTFISRTYADQAVMHRAVKYV